VRLLEAPASPPPARARDLEIRLAEPGEAALVKTFIREHHRILPNPPAGWLVAILALDSSRNVWATATWGRPVARREEQHRTVELTRLTTRDGAPPNTCTRLMAASRRILRVLYPKLERAISYSDDDAHAGTIYRADNWRLVYAGQVSRTPVWTTRAGRIAGTERRSRSKWERSLR
jgi:hypothetical protein